MHTRKLLALASLALVSACSANSTESADSRQQRDRYTSNEDPAVLFPGVSTKLADVVGSGDVGQTFGVDDAHVPYPDTYWPFTKNGIDAQWNQGATDARSPLEKYMAILDPASAQAAKDWEKNNHGSAIPGVSDWWGHCPGWTAAAMSNAPLQHAVLAKSDGAGGIAACNAGDAGCVQLEIGDVNALMAEVWLDGASSFIGARCDTKPADIKRDEYGRIVRNGTGCKGLNAGALMVALAQRMKTQQLPLAIDAQTDSNTDQIWNQPAYRYSVYGFQTLTLQQAANLVAHGTLDGDMTSYPWDPGAKGFVYVDVGIWWVSENGPNTSVVSGLDSTNVTEFEAVLELDSTSDDAAARIVGGEFLDDPNYGVTRLTVPPFVWIASGPSADWGWGHNPYVRTSVVQKLVQMAQQ